MFTRQNDVITINLVCLLRQESGSFVTNHDDGINSVRDEEKTNDIGGERTTKKK